MIKGSNSCVLQLGSNMNDRQGLLEEARVYIQSSVGEILEKSSLYESEPWGNPELNWFLNQVVIINSPHSPIEVLRLCKKIEQSMGRSAKRGLDYENRVIDIDILFYNDEVISEPDLKVPHEKIPQRRFVLEPLVELIPQFVHPVLNLSLLHLLDICEDSLVVKSLGY